MEGTKITVSTSIAAPVHKVWEYYTAPEHITKWNYADESWHCPAAQNDLVVGGKLKSRMEAKDGSFGFDFEATYNAIEPHKSITYTMDDGRQATTTFQHTGGNTEVTTTFDAEAEHSLEMQQGGWQAILNNFKKYTEAN